jgi:hypothetical protein
MASQLVKQTQNGIREEVGGYPDRVLVILTKDCGGQHLYDCVRLIVYLMKSYSDGQTCTIS